MSECCNLCGKAWVEHGTGCGPKDWNPKRSMLGEMKLLQEHIDYTRKLEARLAAAEKVVGAVKGHIAVFGIGDMLFDCIKALEAYDALTKEKEKP